MPDVLPDCRARNPRAVVMVNFGLFQANAVPVFCANNCGAFGGFVPCENMTHAFYLCNPCAEKYGAVAGCMMLPDEVFWERVKQESIARYGHELNAVEQAEELKKSDSIISKLARSRKELTPSCK